MLNSRLLIAVSLLDGFLVPFANAQPNCDSPCTASNPSCCCIVDSYKTVPAHYNGANIDTDIGCFGAGIYGAQFECPEYVLRFYATQLGVSTSSQSWNNWWVKASGIDFFTNASQLGLIANPNCITGPGPGLPPPPGRCSQNAMPQADDIISFCVLSPNTGECEPKKENAGHVAIVKGSPTVNGNTFTVTLIEQNWNKYANGTPNDPALSGAQNADGTYTIFDRTGKCEQLSTPVPGVEQTCLLYAYLRVQGWLRLPSALTQTITFDQPVTFEQPVEVINGIVYSWKIAITQGFTFTAVPNPLYPNVQNTSLMVYGCNTGFVCNGDSNTLQSVGGLTAITMGNTLGQSFSLSSFEAAPPYLSSQPYASEHNSTRIDVTGTQVGGGTLSASFNLTPDTFQTFTLPSGWANLTSVMLAGWAPTCGSTGCWEVAIDNIVVQ
jgi:hypothetical protein